MKDVVLCTRTTARLRKMPWTEFVPFSYHRSLEASERLFPAFQEFAPLTCGAYGISAALRWNSLLFLTVRLSWPTVVINLREVDVTVVTFHV